jgi:ureidoacrylate peracid hydrolase
MTSGHAITIAAKPEPLVLDPRQTAVIVVDMQNHFASPGGTFSNAGIDTSPILALVGPITDVLNTARGAGSKVIYLKMRVPSAPAPSGEPLLRGSAGGTLNRWAHYVDLVGRHDAAAPAEGPAAAKAPTGTWNADILDDLAPLPEDTVVPKHRFSGFFETDLDATLKSLGVKNLIFTGCTTSVCVESTLRDAAFRDYNCVLLADCVAEPIGASLDRTNHDATLLLTELLFGWVSDSAAFVAAFQPQPVLASQ